MVLWPTFYVVVSLLFLSAGWGMIQMIQNRALLFNMTALWVPAQLCEIKLLIKNEWILVWWFYFWHFQQSRFKIMSDSIITKNILLLFCILNHLLIWHLIEIVSFDMILHHLLIRRLSEMKSFHLFFAIWILSVGQ